MDSFAKDFAAQLGVSNIRSNHREIILGALARKVKLPSSAAENLAKTVNSAEWAMCSLDTRYPFEETRKIALRGDRKIAGKSFHRIFQRRHRGKQSVCQKIVQRSIPIWSGCFYAEIE